MENIIVTTGDINKPYKIIGPISVHFTKNENGAYSSGDRLFENGFIGYIQKIKEENTSIGIESGWEITCANAYNNNLLDEYDQLYIAAVCEIKRLARFFNADAVVFTQKNIQRECAYTLTEGEATPLLGNKGNDPVAYHIELCGTAVKYLTREEIVELDILNEELEADKITLRDKVFVAMQERSKLEERKKQAAEAAFRQEQEKIQQAQIRLSSLQLSEIEQRIVDFFRTRVDATPFLTVQDNLKDIPTMDLMLNLKNLEGKGVLHKYEDNSYKLNI